MSDYRLTPRCAGRAVLVGAGGIYDGRGVAVDQGRAGLPPHPALFHLGRPYARQETNVRNGADAPAQVAACMALGASGCWIGTRFLATPESNSTEGNRVRGGAAPARTLHNYST